MSIPVGLALHPAHLISELKTRRMDSVLGEISQQARRSGAVFEPDLLRATLLLRERLGSTALGRGVAVPNARSLVVLRRAVLVGRSRAGLDWGARDGGPVHLVLLVLSPAGARAAEHLASVARVVAAAHPARVRQRLLECAPEQVTAWLQGVLA